jgi:dimethylargininase
MLKSEGDRLKRVVVSTPQNAYFDVATHEAANIPQLADPAATIRQHDRLKDTMTSFGADVVDVPELAGHPNSVFPRDVALCTPAGHIRLRMGLEVRRGEEDWISRELEAMGEPQIGEITAPGTVEGGDVILADDVAFVGLSGRTNAEGARQLSSMLSKMGYEVRTTVVGEDYLHLGGALSMIGPGMVICCRGAVPSDYLAGFEITEVKPVGLSPGNVICLGDGELIANSAENARAVEALE